MVFNTDLALTKGIISLQSFNIVQYDCIVTMSGVEKIRGYNQYV